jgi:hypothetical protein
MSTVHMLIYFPILEMLVSWYLDVFACVSLLLLNSERRTV